VKSPKLPVVVNVATFAAVAAAVAQVAYKSALIAFLFKVLPSL